MHHTTSSQHLQPIDKPTATHRAEQLAEGLEGLLGRVGGAGPSHQQLHNALMHDLVCQHLQLKQLADELNVAQHAQLLSHHGLVPVLGRNVRILQVNAKHTCILSDQANCPAISKVTVQIDQGYYSGLLPPLYTNASDSKKAIGQHPPSSPPCAALHLTIHNDTPLIGDPTASLTLSDSRYAHLAGELAFLLELLLALVEQMSPESVLLAIGVCLVRHLRTMHGNFGFEKERRSPATARMATKWS